MADPYDVLGLHPGVSPGEAASAYRRLAKQLHPDLSAGPGAQERMADVNSAYALVRDELTAGHARDRGRRRGDAPRARVAGGWLPNEVRGALPMELLVALELEEQVHLVVGPQRWAGPELVLAVTDRRLLWLADERVLGRVRSLPYGAIREVEQRARGRGSRTASVHVRTLTDARHSFRGLRPAAAGAVAEHVRARLKSRPSW